MSSRSRSARFGRKYFEHGRFHGHKAVAPQWVERKKSDEKEKAPETITATASAHPSPKKAPTKPTLRKTSEVAARTTAGRYIIKYHFLESVSLSQLIDTSKYIIKYHFLEVFHCPGSYIRQKYYFKLSIFQNVSLS
jgi:hypothetical protein